jgi:magnesium transporter
MDEKLEPPRRRRRTRKRSPPGSAPGTIVVDPAAPRPVLKAFLYSGTSLREETPSDLAALKKQAVEGTVLWLDVAGLGDADVIRAVGAAFGFHPLALEDAVNVHQRPKVETYPDHQFLVARAVMEVNPLDTDQVSFFVGPGYVVTFTEKPCPLFDPVRERLRGGKGQIRTGGPGYLLYALLDAVVDGYFPALEELGERLAAVEDEIVADPRQGSFRRVHELKRDLLQARRAIWPQREALAFLLREGEPAIGKELRVYLNDCYDHTVQLLDLVETYRDIASGLTDIYLSSMSHRLNEVMKVLTVITTIFIPLSFVAGVYGMNFDRSSPWNMPELGWRYGYPACLLVMAAIGVALYLWFRRKGWIGAEAARRGETPPGGTP